jgi:hypothetical protein
MKYLKTYNENMSLAKSIISKKMEGFDKLKSLLSKNLGYIGKFTDYLMNENIPYSDLEILYNDLIALKNKQKNIDISNLKYEELIDKIQEINNDLSVNGLINKFPSAQKLLAKDLISSDYNLLLQTSKKENIDAFIAKISRYKTKEQLKTALSLFGKESINDKAEIKKYVDSSDSSHILVDNGNIMIVKIDKIEDVKKLGSDTSWCILGNASWKSYTTNRYQYILYDFTKDSLDAEFKIGFTLNKDLTIHSAHDILDRDAKPLLNKIIHDNDIKYSSLINKSEKSEKSVTTEMISAINSRTPISTLKSYSESVSRELLPTLLSKIIDFLPKRDGKYSDITPARSELFRILLNSYFIDHEFVTKEDLSKLDRRIPSFLHKLGIKLLRKKLVGDSVNFDSIS